MDRDKEEGHFERQALTMDVIGTYVVDDAPCKVDISAGCRERILVSEVSRWVWCLCCVDRCVAVFGE